MEASRVAGRRRGLRLVCSDGAIVPPVPDPNGEQSDRALSDAEAEEELLNEMTRLRGQLDPASDFRLELSILLAELEQRRARR